jgi:hypothetical protein
VDVLKADAVEGGQPDRHRVVAVRFAAMTL